MIRRARERISSDPGGFASHHFGAVNIEPFVLQQHLRPGFHVFLSVRLEKLLRTAFGDLADAARTTHSMRESHLPVSRHLPVAVTVAVAVRACPIRRSAISDELSDAHGHVYGSAIQ